jgi:hypothetical protein
MNIPRGLTIVVLMTAVAQGASAQVVSPAEREALVRLRVSRGGRAEDVDALIARARDAAAKGLPAAPLANKLREGLAKGHDPQRIDAVLQQMAAQLEAADRLVREVDPSPAAAGLEPSVVLLAEAIDGGVTANEVRELARQTSGVGTAAVSIASLAGAAKGLVSIKEARLPVTDGTAIMAEALRRGYRSHEVQDLGRELKRREADYRADPARLRAVRDAIARGERPEQLFRDSRPERAERPASARPETPERVERPTRPERPQRPEVPERPGARN